MSSQQLASPLSESSGTLVAQDTADSQLESATPLTPSTDDFNFRQEGEEQALESHEVIELQKFSERKAWIEEKIKFLEKMPPIEAFVGLDAIRDSCEDVPGLPTRTELQRWLVEHDAIEKETEIFDSGELKKLKKLTKAATQRNLSPEDTDLIELTLTTIYDLDRLLHLLRDRSENLELLGARLAWEEQRIAAWADRRKIISDLQVFLATCARWSPSAYDTLKEEGSLHRRPSIASISSDCSTSAPSALSRSARFKLAEILSRDAAQFVGRVTSLRHGKISAAGKALDKLIDNSRTPVPEELLDEQDRLEDKGINDMENIDKFVMNVVMQWRKADEVYIETMKDQLAAQTLLEEIEIAKLHHPTARQSTAFVARADGLVKRLQLRSNPASSTSSFPFPSHHLFPDQQDSNRILAETLSSEIATAKDMVSMAEDLAKEYRGSYDAVRHVEAISQDSDVLSTTFMTIIDRLENGVVVSHGDGTPPNLTSEACLEPARHSIFLALLPSIIDELDRTGDKTGTLLRCFHPALLALDRSGIDPTFKTRAASEIQRLIELQERAQTAKKDIISRVNRLQDARKIWILMGKGLKELEDIRRQLGETMETQRWRQQSSRSRTPLTPESPTVFQFPPTAPLDLANQLDAIHAKFLDDIEAPLSSMLSSLETSLNDWLVQSFKGLTGLLESVRQMSRLLEAVQKQAEVMSSIRSEVEEIQFRIEDSRIQFDTAIQQVLLPNAVPQESVSLETDLKTNAQHVHDMAETFIDGLSQRVPFVAQRNLPVSNKGSFVKRRFSSQDLKLGVALQQVPIELPFDPSALDDDVRSDSNSYAMTLSGALQSLHQKGNHLRLACFAKEVDDLLASTVDDINLAARELLTNKGALSTAIENDNVVELLRSLSQDFEDSAQAHRTQILRSFSPIRDLLRRMDSTPGSRDSAVHEVIYLARVRAVNDAELKFNSWSADIETVRDRISETQHLVAQRLEDERVALERRMQAEQEDRAVIEAERLRREQMEAVEKVQAEEARLAEEERQAKRSRLEREMVWMEEKEHHEMGDAQKSMLGQEPREGLRAEQACLEERGVRGERAGEAESLKLEQEAHEAKEQLPTQLEMAGVKQHEQEWSEAVGKLRVGEVRLAEEHWPHPEKQRQTTEDTERSKLGLERREAERQAKKIRSSEEVVARPKFKAQRYKKPSTPSSNCKNLGNLEDVFGLRVVPSTCLHANIQTQEIADLQVRILELRKRLRSMGIHEVSGSRSSSSVHNLPSQERAGRMEADFSALSEDVNQLPSSVDDSSVDIELKSLRAEVEASAQMILRILELAKLSDAIRACDAALSDVLEHIDSFPTPPMELSSSSHVTQVNLSPEDQLTARLLFTKSVINNMSTQFAAVANDPRAVAEHKRILQTWSELEDMGNDRIHGNKSRPASAISSSNNSSGRNSSVGSLSAVKKRNGYSNLSVRPSNQGRFLAPSHPNPNSRRVFSGSTDLHSRSSSRVSTISHRSTSGPINFSSLFSSTYASRQRTTSLSSATPSIQTPSRRPSIPRAQTSQTKRYGSPTFSDGHPYSRSMITPSRPSTSTSTSTWARAPRQSFPTLPRISTPPQNASLTQKRTYVANPKNKLDMAVGEVVNQLPMDINVEVVADTWKDQSGKYWIGDQDPKLCFCRILRSQTVMVRVGGGWTELSKFINDHFADVFRLLPDSPPRSGAREEKWICSTTLLEAPEINETPPPPSTPDPIIPFVPSFSLLTPSGRSPRSLNSTPSTGSPLMPIQFMRRADAEHLYFRPTTPSKASTHRLHKSAPHTPARNSVWRP